MGVSDACLHLGETTEGWDRGCAFYGLTTDADAERHQHCPPKQGSHADLRIAYSFV